MRENKELKIKAQVVPGADSTNRRISLEDFVKIPDIEREASCEAKREPKLKEPEPNIVLKEYIDAQQELIDKYGNIITGLIKVIEKQSAMVDGYQKIIGLILCSKGAGQDE